jgi:hypothetical protein
MAIVTKFHGVYYGVAPMIVEPEDRVDTGLHRASGGIDLIEAVDGLRADCGRRGFRILTKRSRGCGSGFRSFGLRTSAGLAKPGGGL